MLKVYLIRTLNGWQAMCSGKVLCTKSTKEDAVKTARAELGAQGYWMNQVQFIGA